MMSKNSHFIYYSALVLLYFTVYCFLSTTDNYKTYLMSLMAWPPEDESLYTKFSLYWRLQEEGQPVLFELSNYFHMGLSFLSWITTKVFGDNYLAFRLPSTIGGSFIVASFLYLAHVIFQSGENLSRKNQYIALTLLSLILAMNV